MGALHQPDLNKKWKSYHPALDGFRGLALIMVIMTHSTAYPAGGGFPEYTIFHGIWSNIQSFLWFGLEMFFVLSGFLVTGILINTRNHAHYYKNYYFRRILRVFPLYWVMLILGLVIVPNLPYIQDLPYLYYNDKGHPTWKDAMFYIFFMANFKEYQHHTIMLFVTWSLSIEEHYYMVWPHVVKFLKKANVLRVCFWLIVTGLCFRIYFVSVTDNPMVPYMWTMCRWDALAMGSALGMIWHSPGGAEKIDYVVRKYFPLLTGILIGYVLIMRFGIYSGENYKVEYLQLTPIGQTIGFSIVDSWCCLLMAYIHLQKSGTLVQRFFETKILTGAGKYSYAVYLVHIPVLESVKYFFFRPYGYFQAGGKNFGVWEQLLFFALVWLFSMILAIGSWKFIEGPALSLKKYFSYSKKPKDSSGTKDAKQTSAT